MKKIALAVLSSLLFATSVIADTCGTSLIPQFTSFQATNLCKTFGSAVNTSQIPATDNTYDLGSSSKQWRNAYIKGALTSGGGIYVDTGTLAATGNSQGTAAPIVNHITYGTACDGTKGFTLPAGNIGETFEIINTVTNSTCPVYPPTSGTINGGSANAAYTLQQSVTGDFTKVAANTWFVQVALDTSNTVVLGSGLTTGTSGDLTVGNNGRILMGTSASRLVGGSSSFSIRNNANNADNIITTDAGAVTVRLGATLANGNLAFTTAQTGVADNIGTLAAAGSTQTDAAAIVTTVVRVTGSDGTKGVKLPALASVSAGRLITIINSDVTNLVKVYSNAAGETITGQSGTTAISLAAKLMLRCWAYDGSNWYCEKGVLPY